MIVRHSRQSRRSGRGSCGPGGRCPTPDAPRGGRLSAGPSSCHPATKHSAAPSWPLVRGAGSSTCCNKAVAAASIRWHRPSGSLATKKHIEKVDMMNQAVQRTRRRLMSAGEPSTSVSAASTRRSRPLSSCSRVSSPSAPSCCPSQLSASFSACAAVPNYMPIHIALHFISVRGVLADANRGALELTEKAFIAMDDPMLAASPCIMSTSAHQQGEHADSHLRRTGRVLTNKMGLLPGQLKGSAGRCSGDTLQDQPFGLGASTRAACSSTAI